jgi:hypothetical protein
MLGSRSGLGCDCRWKCVHVVQCLQASLLLLQAPQTGAKGAVAAASSVAAPEQLAPQHPSTQQPAASVQQPSSARSLHQSASTRAQRQAPTLQADLRL